MNKRVHLSINEQLLDIVKRLRNTSLRALSFGGCG